MIVALFRLEPEDLREFNAPHNLAKLVWCSRFPDKPLDRLIDMLDVLSSCHHAVYWYRYSEDFGLRFYLSASMLVDCPNSQPTTTVYHSVYQYLYEEKNYVESIPTEHLHRIRELCESFLFRTDSTPTTTTE